MLLKGIQVIGQDFGTFTLAHLWQGLSLSYRLTRANCTLEESAKPLSSSMASACPLLGRFASTPTDVRQGVNSLSRQFTP